MTLNIQKAERRPFIVEYVEITAENMKEAAKWCKGRVQHAKYGDETRPYIKVDVTHAANTRQTKGFVGDLVLRTISGFRVYTRASFDKSFRIPIVYTEADAADQLVDYPEGHVPQVDFRDAGTGQFISQAEAEENPETTVREVNP